MASISFAAHRKGKDECARREGTRRKGLGAAPSALGGWSVRCRSRRAGIERMSTGHSHYIILAPFAVPKKEEAQKVFRKGNKAKGTRCRGISLGKYLVRWRWGPTHRPTAHRTVGSYCSSPFADKKIRIPEWVSVFFGTAKLTKSEPFSASARAVSMLLSVMVSVPSLWLNVMTSLSS